MDKIDGLVIFPDALYTFVAVPPRFNAFRGLAHFSEAFPTYTLACVDN